MISRLSCVALAFFLALCVTVSIAEEEVFNAKTFFDGQWTTALIQPLTEEPFESKKVGTFILTGNQTLSAEIPTEDEDEPLSLSLAFNDQQNVAMVDFTLFTSQDSVELRFERLEKGKFQAVANFEKTTIIASAQLPNHLIVTIVRNQEIYSLSGSKQLPEPEPTFFQKYGMYLFPAIFILTQLFKNFGAAPAPVPVPGRRVENDEQAPAPEQPAAKEERKKKN